ncbi:MAG: TRAM domain-containing protein [Fimbriimonas sp.]|nr:TRAM domain-containing protein [Fimbriimonas sp.]
MKGLPKGRKVLPLLAGPKAAARTITVLACAVIGAILLGSVAPAILDWLYQLIVNLLNKGKGASDLSVTEPLKKSVFTTFPPFAVLGAILGAFLGLRFVRGLERIGSRWDRMEIGDKVTFFVGIFAGLIASVPLLLMFQALELPGQYRLLLILGVTVGFGALSVYTLQSMAEILPWTRGTVRRRRSGIKLLDTNVIIDGRIYDVAKTGFLSGEMYVPGFVLEELQYIADSHDALKRQRGRRGLEVLNHMRNEFDVQTQVHDKLAPEQGDGVDSRLVRLAKAIGADIVTNDFNLRRVAEFQDVHVMSLNDLALALRPNVLPQETFELTIIREGNQVGQGVGYLEDGTMVVVENGKPHVGETVEIVVTQVIQTERGKMIFGEVDTTEPPPPYEIRARRKPTSPRNGL